MNQATIYCRHTLEEKINGQWVPAKQAREHWERILTEKEYKLLTGKAAVSFFRSIGALESITYHPSGRVKQLTSISPNRQQRATYSFEYLV